jgi:hypothetical protein
VHARLYRPCVTQFSTKASPENTPLGRHLQKLEDTIDLYVQKAKLAA